MSKLVLSRRRLLFAAPAFIAASSLMPVKAWREPPPCPVTVFTRVTFFDPEGRTVGSLDLTGDAGYRPGDVITFGGAEYVVDGIG